MQVPVHDFEGDLKFGLWHDGLLVVGRVPDGHAAKYCKRLHKPKKKIFFKLLDSQESRPIKNEIEISRHVESNKICQD